MSHRWLLTLAVICGLFAAPLAMASERVQPPRAPGAMSHCAQAGDADEKAPAKPFRCMGACIAVEPAVTALPDRLAAMPAPAHRASVPAFRGIATRYEPPPPRRA